MVEQPGLTLRVDERDAELVLTLLDLADELRPAAVAPTPPEVSASSAVSSPISRSGTPWIDPPDSRVAAIAASPSAGLPIASERAIVSGRTGFTGRSSANAAATGEQPTAWPPTSRGAAPLTSPSSRKSRNPRATFECNEPDAIGQTTTSGSSHPSCSATSYATVFD